MGILSIQSQVVSGHVGNSAAVFALQRLGAEIWPLPTVILSNHPGHGRTQGGLIPVALKYRLLDGLQDHGCFGRCEAVISGYLGAPEDAALVQSAVARGRAGTPGCVYLCDPVLGDDGRLYVAGEIVEAVHNLAAIADIMTPNAYELSLLSNRCFNSCDTALQALRAVQARGPRIVLLSSFCGSDTAAGMIDVMAVDGQAGWRLSMPKLDYKFSGAGDVLAALFLHFWLAERDAPAAMQRACGALFGVLRATMAARASELSLIAAQALLAAPDCHFSVERVA